MDNPNSKKPLIPVRFLPGKNVSGLLDNLNIPEIDILYVNSYQHRTKFWRVEGYSTRNKKRKEYRLNINGFKAWKIGFKNKHQTPVNIFLHYTIKGKVLSTSYNQTFSDLLPDKEAEMVVISGLKTGQVRLDSIDVYSGSNLLSRTEFNVFMPYWKGNSLFSFISSWVLGICFLLWNIYKEPDSIHEHHAITWLTYISLSLAILDVYNITPVIIMLLLLVAGPFILHDPVQLATLMVLGCLYIWAVWRKRSSIKDFLIGAFIP